MEIKRFQYLLTRYFENSLDQTEKQELLYGISHFSNEEFVDILSEMDFPTDFDATISEEEVSRKLTTIFENLLLDERLNDVPKIKKEKKSANGLYFWTGIAAAFLVLFGASIYLLTINNQEQVQANYIVQDIEPAQSMAMIVLENGDKITVDSTVTGLVYDKGGLQVYINEEGEVLYKDLNEDEQVQYLTVNTPKGGHTKLKLSDGSVIELNAASSIRYPVNFESEKREVFVEGQAYFKVSPDKDRPFIVHSKKQDIQVLGTSFNLVSTDEYAKTTLIEGSVEIHSGGNKYLLKPGQQSVVAENVNIKYLKPEIMKVWNNEKFVFDNSSFKEILREVENWYDVKMVFYEQDFDNIELSGTVSRGVRLSELLKVLEINTNYTFEIEGRRVLVKRY
ncbi:FecR family protein [Sphingobacterium hungaricum]